MRAALDTNVLAYAEGVGDADRQKQSLDLLERVPDSDVVLPAQTLGELFRVLTGKQGRPRPDARNAILQWTDAYAVADSTWWSFQSAFDLCTDHGLQVWDALILSVAADNHCRILLSEDFHEGFTWRGTTVVNPYADSPHSLMP